MLGLAYGGIATPKRGLVDAPGSYGGNDFKGQKYFTDELGKERRTEGFKKYLKSKSKYNVERIPQTELDKAITYYSNKFPDLNEAQIIKKARTGLYNLKTKTGSFNWVDPTETTITGTGTKSERITKSAKNKLRLALANATKSGEAIYFNSLADIGKKFNVDMTDSKISQLVREEFSDVVKLEDNIGVKFKNWLKTNKTGKVTTSVGDLIKESKIKNLTEANAYRIVAQFPNISLKGQDLHRLKKTKIQRKAFDLFLNMDPTKPYTRETIAKKLKVSVNEADEIVRNMSVKAWENSELLGKGEKIKSPAFKGLTQSKFSKVLNNLGYTDDFDVIHRRGVYNDLVKIYGTPGSKSYDPEIFTELYGKVKKYNTFKKELAKKFPNLNLSLDHGLSQNVIRRAINVEKLDPSEILRVRPLPERLNTFKTAFDRKQIYFQKELQKIAGKNKKVPKELLEEKKAFEELGTKIFGKNYSIGKIGLDGKVIDFGSPKLGEESLTTQTKKGLRLYERIQNIARNLDNSPQLQNLFKAAGMTTDALKAFGQLKKFNPTGAIQAINKILKNNPDLRVQLLGDEYKDIKNYYAALDTTMTDATYVDSPIVEKGLSTGEKAAIGTGSAATIGSKFTKTDPLKKFRRFITAAPVRKGFGKILRGAGTPIAGPIFAGTNIYSKMKEGKSLGEAVMDPLTGLELSFPGLFKQNISKITKSPTLQKILGLGRVGRMLTPVGLGLTALGQGQEFYNQYQDLQKMKRDDPDAYQQFRSQRVGPALTEEDYKDIYSDVQGAAGGGIVGIRRPNAIPPEKGPQSQGLDYLRYYGT